MPLRTGNTDRVVASGVFQGTFKPIGGQVKTNSTRTAALTAFASLPPHSGEPVSSITGSGAASGDKYVYTPGNTSHSQVVPYGSGASGTYWQFSIYGEKEMDWPDDSGSYWVRRPIGKINGTLGGQVVGAGLPIASGMRMADVITVAADYTPGSGMRVGGNPTDGCGYVVFETSNNERIVMEPSCTVPAGAPSGTSGVVAVNGLQADF